MRLGIGAYIITGTFESSVDIAVIVIPPKARNGLQQQDKTHRKRIHPGVHLSNPSSYASALYSMPPSGSLTTFSSKGDT